MDNNTYNTIQIPKNNHFDYSKCGLFLYVYWFAGKALNSGVVLQFGFFTCSIKRWFAVACGWTMYPDGQNEMPSHQQLYTTRY